MRAAAVLLIAGCAGAGTGGAVPPSNPPPPATSAAPAGIPVPNRTLTPGAVFAGVTAAQVCASGYASSVRDVPASEKRQVYAEYHVADVPGADEVDHLISLELGGSNDIRNLWPEPYAGPYGAHSKDRVEDYLHAQVCAGTMTLAAAQQGIADHWWTFLPAVGVPVPDGPPPHVVATGPPSSGVQITGPPRPVAAGDTEALTARTTPHTTCTLTVTLPSGAQSRSGGLGAATTDSAGTVTWTWRTGTSTAPGTATATVTCPTGTASASFSIG